MRPRANRSAFTLIELVISSALMTLILVSGYACLSSGLSSQKLIESRAEIAQNARIAMARMTADLRCACPLSKDIDFLGMPRRPGEVKADNLDFATHNYTPRRAGEGDFCAVSYFLAREPSSGKLSLWRRRNPVIAPEPLAGGSREEIARGLRGLKFEYFDGFDWYQEWGDPQGRHAKAQNSLKYRPNLEGLPEAVRITLWFDLAAVSASKDSASQEVKESTLAFQTVCRLNLAGVSLRKKSIAPAGGGSPASQSTPVTPNEGKQ